MKIDLMTLGGPLRTIQELARDASGAGFDGMVVTEGGRSAYLSCAAAALASDLDLATGIAVAFPRSPMVTAQSAWELADATGGRFRLGIGTQVRAHMERRYGVAFDHPGPRLAEYVQAVKACFAAFRGAPLEFHGEYHDLSLLPAQWSPGPISVADPAVDIAAVNPYMVRVAGAVADGIHVHPLNHRRYIDEVVLPNLRAGASASGRDPTSLHLTVPAFTAVGDTEDERRRWRELARAQVAFYGSTPNYAFIFDMLGAEGTTARIRERQKAGDFSGMAALIDDDLLEHFVVSGTFDEMPAKLVERYGSVADRVVLYFAVVARGDDGEALGRWGGIAREVARLSSV